MKLTIIGSGYVGLTTGACFAQVGHQVMCVDNNVEKIERLLRGEIPIYEPGLEELVQRNAAEGRLSFTTDMKEAIAGSEVVFICVGTPQRSSGKADLTYVLQAAENVARHMDRFLVIVTKSTVPVGTAERITRLMHEASRSDFEVVSNPEFLKEGAAIKDFQNPDRIIVGTESARAREIMTRLYAPLARVNRPILFMNPQTAELVKYARIVKLSGARVD